MSETMDAEVAACNAIVQSFSALDDEARQRVIHWALSPNAGPPPWKPRHRLTASKYPQ